MPGEADIASVALLLSDPTRATILLTLSDGRAFTASELAKRAKVTPSTASEHLARLVDASLLLVEKQGRHRFFRLADPTVVGIMEDLALLAPRVKIHSLGEAESAKAIYKARMCYNHVAGTLGVALTEKLVERQVLRVMEAGYLVDDAGIRWLEEFGIASQPLKKHGVLFVPWHIDWSERKHHMAGAFGAAFARRLFDLKWIERHSTNRALSITPHGREALEQAFDLHV